MRVEGKQLYLRESSFDDCAIFARWEVRPEVTEFFTMDRDRDYEQVVREYLGRLNDPTKMQFTVCLRETDEPVGRIYLSRIDAHDDSLDITRIYIAEKAMRGKGLGEEALQLALYYAFAERHCERVSLDHFAENRIAAKLYRKTGFHPEGIMRNAGKKNAGYVDLHLMSMLREEYSAVSGSWPVLPYCKVTQE